MCLARRRHRYALQQTVLMTAGAFFMLMSCLWAFVSGVVCVWETQRVVIAKEEEKGEGRDGAVPVSLL